MTFAEHAAAYRARLQAALAALEQPALAELAERLDQLRAQGGRVYLAGNGGSAATASHFANDLSAAGLDAVCLSDSLTAVTALANDRGFEEVFAQQLRHRLRRGDLLLLLSASGNSPNLLRALELAQVRGATVVAITGFDGGEARRRADLSVQVPTDPGDYGPAEDVHLAIDHLLSGWLRRPVP